MIGLEFHTAQGGYFLREGCHFWLWQGFYLGLAACRQPFLRPGFFVRADFAMSFCVSVVIFEADFRFESIS